MAASTDLPQPRTLTESLRGWPPMALEQLLLSRPDLADPAPRDIAELVSRSTTSLSTARALESLNCWLRTAAEGLAALPDPASVATLADLLGESPTIVAHAVAELRARALVWGSDQALHLVRPAREAFEPYPGGLAPPSARPLSEPRVADALARCSAPARAVLNRLRWHPSGAVRNADRTVPAAGARSPIDELLALELIRPADSETVIIPREVAWLLRDGRFTAEPVPTAPPPVAVEPRDTGRIDRAAAGAIVELLADLELVVQTLEATPHRLLRTGGLGARDVLALARRLGNGTEYATFLLECAAAAGLVAAEGTMALLPTREYDHWVRRSTPKRWRRIAEAWAYADRLFTRSSLAGAHALGPEADVAGVAALRSTVLQLLAEAGPGGAPDRDQIAAAAAWHRPRLRRPLLGQPPLDAERLVGWTWREAGWLGLVSGDAVSSFARALIDTRDPLPAALTELFPAPLEMILIQADLTAVAAGPLAYEIAQDLRRLADQESRGAGGVYRFSADSLRRAYDAGWSAGEISVWLERHSATGVPQALRYLVEDVSRRHGSIRVGPAASYLRVADEAQAAALLTHPDAAAIGLRAVAPTVLVATVEEDELLAMGAERDTRRSWRTRGRPLLAPAGSAQRDTPADRGGRRRPAAAGAGTGTPPERRLPPAGVSRPGFEHSPGRAGSSPRSGGASRRTGCGTAGGRARRVHPDLRRCAGVIETPRVCNVLTKVNTFRQSEPVRLPLECASACSDHQTDARLWCLRRRSRSPLSRAQRGRPRPSGRAAAH